MLQAIHGSGASGWLLVLAAGAIGAGAAALYISASAARLTLTVLAPAPVLFLAVFLFHSDVSRLTLGATGSALAAGERPRTPVVLIAFDELPLNSLLDARGRIDPVRFPNFARLARGSTWFANASTVAEGTTHAVPAILTGKFPRAGELPVYADHRQNLFTLLGGATRLHVADEETHLCPPKLCPGLEGSFGSRMESLAEDSGVVYLRELLPDDLASGIPSIANGWGNFLRDESAHHDPGRLPASFVESLRPGTSPELWYAHLMLPHSPWQYLPSGRRYSVRSAPAWGSDEVWTDNQAAVDQSWQRHLLQLGYADRVLGGLVSRLRATGLYGRALVVVTADHGVSFRAGQKRRPLSSENLQDIAYVPLFMKLPGQKHGRVVRAPARTIDILPTIARELRVNVPWSLDGRPLLPSPATERDVVLIKDHGRRFVIPEGELEAKREQALRRQVTLFGSDEPAATLYAIGPYRSLLGKPIGQFRIRSGGTATLDGLDASTDPVQASGRVPASVRNVAVAADGRIVAVVPAAQGRFWALVPGLGHAHPQLYSIDGPLALSRLTQ